MRGRTGWVFLLMAAMALVLAQEGCTKKKSSRPPAVVAPSLQSADYADVNVSAAVDAGDTVVVTFDGSVMVATPPLDAAATFLLTEAVDTFASASTVIAGPLATQVTITVGAGAVFNPVDIYPAAGASGISVLGSQSGITYGAGVNVPSLGSPVDIQGDLSLGLWTSVSASMNDARVGHSATLLANGEILLAGGLNDQQSVLNPNFRATLATLEVFDPSSGTFSPRASLVRPRAFHNAVLTPGLDDLMGTNDEYVVMIGGWNSEVQDNNGPHSEGSVEIVVPDPNGDGDTSDLVVNPLANWFPPGTPTPSGQVVDELGLSTFGGVGASPGCPDADIPVGIQLADFDWAPETYFANLVGASTGLGNNELLGLGSFSTWIWDDCSGQQALYFYTSRGCTPISDSRPWLAVDPDEDGDFWDNDLTDPDPANWTYDGMFLGWIGGSFPWTTPFSFVRAFHTQTRVAGTDGIDGTGDDVLLVYGGEGFDMSGACLAAVCQNPLGNLEFFDNAAGINPILTSINDAYTSCNTADCAGTCGLRCTSPGVGPTDRSGHIAVASGNSNQDVVLLGGFYSNFGIPGAECGQAVELLTPNFSNPAFSTMTYGGNDSLAVRGWFHAGAALEGSGNVLVTGGVDVVAGGSTASSVYVNVGQGGTVIPMPDMAEPRDLHAAVSYPASLGFFSEDRVYVFGGWNRPGNTNRYYIYNNVAMLSATTSATAEYFTE